MQEEDKEISQRFNVVMMSQLCTQVTVDQGKSWHASKVASTTKWDMISCG